MAEQTEAQRIAASLAALAAADAAYKAENPPESVPMPERVLAALGPTFPAELLVAYPAPDGVSWSENEGWVDIAPDVSAANRKKVKAVIAKHDASKALPVRSVDLWKARAVMELTPMPNGQGNVLDAVRDFIANIPDVQQRVVATQAFEYGASLERDNASFNFILANLPGGPLPGPMVDAMFAQADTLTA